MPRMHPAATEDDAKRYFQAIKQDAQYTTQPLKTALGDEAFIRTKKNATTSPYALDIRIGKSIVTVEMETEQPDTSADAYEAHALPLATAVLNNLRKLTN